MAKALDTTVDDIKEEDIPQSIINNYDNSSGSYFPHINNNYSIPEFILKNMEDYINLLKNQIEELKEEIRSLKS